MIIVLQLHFMKRLFMFRPSLFMCEALMEDWLAYMYYVKWVSSINKAFIIIIIIIIIIILLSTQLRWSFWETLIIGFGWIIREMLWGIEQYTPALSGIMNIVLFFDCRNKIIFQEIKWVSPELSSFFIKIVIRMK